MRDLALDYDVTLLVFLYLVTNSLIRKNRPTSRNSYAVTINLQCHCYPNREIEKLSIFNGLCLPFSMLQLLYWWVIEIVTPFLLAIVTVRVKDRVGD